MCLMCVHTWSFKSWWKKLTRSQGRKIDDLGAFFKIGLEISVNSKTLKPWNPETLNNRRAEICFFIISALKSHTFLITLFLASFHTFLQLLIVVGFLVFEKSSARRIIPWFRLANEKVLHRAHSRTTEKVPPAAARLQVPVTFCVSLIWTFPPMLLRHFKHGQIASPEPDAPLFRGHSRAAKYFKPARVKNSQSLSQSQTQRKCVKFFKYSNYTNQPYIPKFQHKRISSQNKVTAWLCWKGQREAICCNFGSAGESSWTWIRT